MTSLGKAKEWINQHFPSLKVFYENKYVGMAYDQFASLPAQKQKQVILSIFGVIFLVVMLLLLSFFLDFYKQSNLVSNSEVMMGMLQDFEKSKRDQDSKLFLLERNSQLQDSNAIKRFIGDQARVLNISPRLVKVEEMPPAGDSKDGPSTKQALVKLERVNLSQLMALLQAVEYGSFAVKVGSLRVKNDEKIRGYLHAEFLMEVHFLQAGGGG